MNPLRYRGYVYDKELELYYLQSRYYDPEMGRFISADMQISAPGGELLGNNMFAYCFNNPVNMSDPDGNWPKWLNKIVALDNNIFIQHLIDVADVIEDVAEDINNYDSNNQSEETSLAANYFSSYKGVFVVKTNFQASFSFGIIGLSRKHENINSLNHEYGHALQLANKGIVDYTFDVAVPSVTINLLERAGKLKYDYYGAPWEAEADRLGGVIRYNDNDPWPEGAVTSYFDLLKMFWE